MVGILAQVDLLAVVALEPPGGGRRFRRQLGSPVTKQIDEESRFGVGPAGRNTEVYVVEEH